MFKIYFTSEDQAGLMTKSAVERGSWDVVEETEE